jgi:predicted transcriptional regulator
MVNEAGEQIGPLVSGMGFSTSEAVSAATEEISRQLGVSSANLQKLIDLQDKRGINLFSSADLSFYLNVTPRSASRILAKLAEYGGASVVRNAQPNSKGRPYKIYDVDYRKLNSGLFAG